ncbi:MAG: hypothetical protein LLG20_22785 [Acidobacteriales bacterium]|nr:hypothetical protein [Terriglobales bacterium]
MDLKFLSLGRKAINFGIVLNPDSDDETNATEERRITAHEAPLPELSEAFAKLAPVVCEILELEPSWADGLSVTRIAISYTKAGTRSVKFKCTKQLECRKDYLWKLDTPMCQVDKPADGESGQIDIEDKKHLKLVLNAIKEAERYAKGERSQQLLNFDEAKAALQATADIGGRDMFSGTEG